MVNLKTGQLTLGGHFEAYKRGQLERNIHPSIKISAGIILITMLLGFLTMAPNIMDNYFGLKQRFFHIGWSLWFIYLSLMFSELDKKSVGKVSPATNTPENTAQLASNP